jgi:hypothetical protein
MSELSQKDQAVRRAFFAPCLTKDDLARWIRVFLNINLPDRIVSEESNSSPLSLVWEVYDRSRRNDTEDFSRVMAYASRFGGKTLGAGILEVATVLHLGRNVSHMAAISRQSKKAQEYVKGFFNKPILRDFKYGDNASEVRVVYYKHNSTGNYINDVEFRKLDGEERKPYERFENYIRIVVCNMAGANGDHTELAVTDEVDVIPRQNIPAYHQAKSIPSSRSGMLPVSLLTSTRKSRIGMVQAELDAAEDTGLQVRHWNIIDIAEPCKPERHRPELPKQTYYINDVNVKHITQQDFDVMSTVEQGKHYAVDGYAGCEKCKLFPACKGRLATHQTGSTKDTALLFPITGIINKFRENTAEYITTEYLCRKPDTSGLIYPRLNRAVHVKSATEIAEMVSGDPQPQVTDKASLLSFLKERGAHFATGMDFGFSHNFAAVTGAIWGQNCFILDVVAQKELELDDKVEACSHLRDLDPVVFGDPEAPADIKTFKRKGFRMKTWNKFKGSVKAGIEIVRTKLYTIGQGASIFFLADDPGVELLLKRMENYAFTTDAAGQFTQTPEEDDDDENDSLRYVIMNIFAKGGVMKQQSLPDPPPTQVDQKALARERQNSWMSEAISEALGGGHEDVQTADSGLKIKKGGFFGDF